MVTLSNDKIRFTVDDAGNLTELCNLATGHNYAGNRGLWRIIYQHEEVLEEEITAENCRPEITAGENDIKLCWSSMVSEAGPVAFQLEIQASLADDEVRFTARLRNASESAVLREFQFPFVKNVQLTSGQQFYWSYLGGARYRDIAAELDRCHTQYMGQDNKALEKSGLYPGFFSTNCYTFADTEQGLYIGSHDPTFQNTLHLLRKRGKEIDAGMVKYSFLQPGETTEIAGYTVAPYQGNWHTAKKHYRRWADNWFKPGPVPASILNSNGWHRIIMRHQYGKKMFRHDEMPKILKSGLEAGIDTLFMFGWYKGGHDSNYPEFNFDETQGGRDALKEQIRQFRADGGKLILYFNGQLIDTDTEFYRTRGKHLCVKNPNGSEHMEWYPFGGDGTALRQFGNKSFVTACPGCREWVEHLKKQIDKALDLGVDGIFFDQLGWTSRPCCDPTHGHRVPFHTVMAAKGEMLREMRAYLKAKAPEVSFGIEWISDVTACHVDFIHNITGATDVYNPDWKAKGEKPDLMFFPEWTRYIFPEIITTDRDIRDDTDIERRVNMAVLRGYRSDVEIYRCRATIDATPHYKEYLTRVDQLRDRQRDLILNGAYIDTDGFTLDNPELFAAAFRSGNRLAVVVTQSHLEEAETVLRVPGYRYTEYDGLNQVTITGSGDTAKLKLGRHGLAVVIFTHQKKGSSK